jgi:hypothetical protein
MTKTRVVTDSLDISFDGTIDATGALQLLYDGEALSGYDGFAVACEATDAVNFRLNGFRHADKIWSVSGNPKVSMSTLGEPLPGPWTTDTVVGIMTGAVEVTITASAQGETPKTQKIFVKTKSRTDLPDDQMA